MAQHINQSEERIEQAIASCGFERLIEHICKKYGLYTFNQLCKVHNLPTIRQWMQDRLVILGTCGSRAQPTRGVAIASSNRKRKGVDVEGQLAKVAESLRDASTGHLPPPVEGTSVTRRHSTTGILVGRGSKRPRELEESESLHERRRKAPRLDILTSQIGAQPVGYLRTPESPPSRQLEQQAQTTDSLVPLTSQTLSVEFAGSSVQYLQPITPPASPLPSIDVLAPSSPNPPGPFDIETPTSPWYWRSAGHTIGVVSHGYQQSAAPSHEPVPHSTLPSASYVPPMYSPTAEGLGLYQIPQMFGASLSGMPESGGMVETELPVFSPINIQSLNMPVPDLPAPGFGTEEPRGGHAAHAIEFMSRLDEPPSFATTSHPTGGTCLPEFLTQMDVPPAQGSAPSTPGCVQSQASYLDTPPRGTVVSPVVNNEEVRGEGGAQADSDHVEFQLDPELSTDEDWKAWLAIESGLTPEQAGEPIELPGQALETMNQTAPAVAADEGATGVNAIDWPGHNTLGPDQFWNL